MGNSRSKHKRSNSLKHRQQHIQNKFEYQQYNLPLKVPSPSIASPVQINTEFINNEISKQTKHLSETLHIDETKCLLLLRKYEWNTDQLMKSINMWSNKDLNQILSGAGIYIESKKDESLMENNINTATIECKMCMNLIKKRNFYGMECGHNQICKTCWTDYLQYSTKTKQCVFATCPQFACNIVVKTNVFKSFLEAKHETEYQRYLRFCRANFIEHSSDLLMCPYENCEMVYKIDMNMNQRFIECLNCNHTFCAKCLNSPHKQQECKDSWLESSSNLLWILKHTKPCPNCKRRVEKNEGSIHMTCRRHASGCGHEWCWLCLGNWTTHGSYTGGYYQCNIYENNIKEFILIDSTLMMYYKKYHNINDSMLENIHMIKCEMGTKHENEFLFYQLAKEWLKTLDSEQTYEQSLQHFMKGFVSFNTMRENILLLVNGYSRRASKLYIPLELIECCVSFYVNVNSFVEESDEWDESSVVQHAKNKQVLKNVLFENDQNRVLQIRKDDFVTVITIQTKLQITPNVFIRHLWNIKISFLESDDICRETIKYFEVGICSEVYDKTNKYYGIRQADLNNMNNGLNADDVISILMINYDREVLLKFALNGETLANKTTIFNMKQYDETYRLQITVPENLQAELF